MTPTTFFTMDQFNTFSREVVHTDGQNAEIAGFYRERAADWSERYAYWQGRQFRENARRKLRNRRTISETFDFSLKINK